MSSWIVLALFAGGAYLLVKRMRNSWNNIISTDPKGLRALSGFENFTRGVVDVTRVFNISTSILLEDQQITESDLRESLDALQNKFAMLQCYVTPIGKTRRFKFVEMNPVKPIEFNTVEYKDGDASKQRITHQLELELNNPLGTDQICRARIVFFRSTQQTLLIWTMDHSCVDGRGSSYLLKELTKMVLKNKPRDPNPKLVPIPPSPEVLFAAKGVPKLLLKAWSVFQLAKRFIGKSLHEFPRSNYDQAKYKLPDQDQTLLYHTILSLASLDAASTDKIVKKAKETNCTVGTVVYAALSAAITERIIQRKNEKKEKVELNKQHFLGTINVDERALLKHIYGDRFSDDELGPGYFTCFSLIFTRTLGTWYDALDNPKKLWDIAPILRNDWKRDMSRGIQFAVPALLESRSLTVDIALKSFLEKGTISQPNIALIFSNLGNLDGSFKLDQALTPDSLNNSHERPMLTSSHASSHDLLARKKKESTLGLRRSTSVPTSPAVPRTNKVDVSLRTSSIAIPLFDQTEQDIISRARVFGAATAGGTTEFLASCFTLNGQLQLAATFNSVAHTREACDQLLDRVSELLKLSVQD
eukprot:TRINITY_DN2810_c0_g1_i1.p1 TRINITY_DN2810_c0_g1~~TRINITY_DN2810_c0_g1_i1.p1  ORF type:complete len:598 (+),score=126.84 TRINITY_DN2810_c0_g1_i1:36-1796(+)